MMMNNKLRKNLVSPRSGSFMEMQRQYRIRIKNATSKVDSYRGGKPKSKVKKEQEYDIIELLKNYIVKMKPAQYTFSRGPGCVRRSLFSSDSERKSSADSQEVNKITVQGSNFVTTTNPDIGKSQSKMKPINGLCVDLEDKAMIVLNSWKKMGINHNVTVDVLKYFIDALGITNPKILWKFLRPILHLDVQTPQGSEKPSESIGLQLYTESCPAIVLEFLQAAKANESNRLAFKRNFLPYWMEWELRTRVKYNLISDCTITDCGADRKMVGSGTGDADVLTFPQRYLRGMDSKRFTFTINFEPLATADSKRIVFGEVVKGKKLLDYIKYAPVNWNGNPLKHFVVSKLASSLYE